MTLRDESIKVHYVGDTRNIAHLSDLHLESGRYGRAGDEHFERAEELHQKSGMGTVRRVSERRPSGCGTRERADVLFNPG